MKFVGDSISFTRFNHEKAVHTVQIPIYHRAALGLFPGTRIFAVPRTGSNEIILSPIDPATWGDLWRLDATVIDRPGSARALVETLVDNQVNVLVHEGVSESLEDGELVHRVFEVLDLSSYDDDDDGTTTSRNSIDYPELRPNRLINRVIDRGSKALIQTRSRDNWELKIERMEFFYRNKEIRRRGVELILNDDKAISLPVNIFRGMPAAADVPTRSRLALHIISDTEQKYVKLRVLDRARYYLLLEIEHQERVGAINEFMKVLKEQGANMIDSYSRLKRVSETALFYTFSEFEPTANTETMTEIVLELVKRLVDSDQVQTVILKGAFGAGPELRDIEAKLPDRALVRIDGLPRTPVFDDGTKRAQSIGVGQRDAVDHSFGEPFYATRHDAVEWTLNRSEVFMAIPFVEEYLQFYEHYLSTVVRDSGLDPIRIDLVDEERILRPRIYRIEEAIARSRFVIADLSEWNPNVIYEVGLASGISKPMLLLCRSEHFDEGSIPFDFTQYPFIKYSPYQPDNLKRDLSLKVEQMMAVTSS